jgi:hypothetical protein
MRTVELPVRATSCWTTPAVCGSSSCTCAKHRWRHCRRTCEVRARTHTTPTTLPVPGPPLTDMWGAWGLVAEVFTEESFWLGAQQKPRCALERLALDLFNFHTKAAAGSFDIARSGAEWCAVRVSGTARVWRLRVAALTATLRSQVGAGAREWSRRGGNRDALGQGRSPGG